MELLPNGFFRDLDPDDELRFRAWARLNWTAGATPNALWHPVVRDEWSKIDREQASHDQT